MKNLAIGVGLLFGIVCVFITMVLLNRKSPQPIISEPTRAQLQAIDAATGGLETVKAPLTTPAGPVPGEEVSVLVEASRLQALSSGSNNAQKKIPAARPSPRQPPAKEPIQDPLARVALSFVGADLQAEQYWVAAINNPDLPDHERQDLIEDLNEDGISDPEHPAAEDLPLIISRILLIDELAPWAMDQVNADAFQEAKKDLINMADGLLPELWANPLKSVPQLVEGLNSGADDYLPMPFALAELVARVRALTRPGAENQPTELRLADFTLDPAHRHEVEDRGLGLGIAQWVVSMHKGTIRIDSMPAKLTTVTVCLPLLRGNGTQ